MNVLARVRYSNAETGDRQATRNLLKQSPWLSPHRQSTMTCAPSLFGIGDTFLIPATTGLSRVDTRCVVGCARSPSRAARRPHPDRKRGTYCRRRPAETTSGANQRNHYVGSDCPPAPVRSGPRRRPAWTRLGRPVITASTYRRSRLRSPQSCNWRATTPERQRRQRFPPVVRFVSEGFALSTWPHWL